jgi:hypothetical protein
VPGVEIHAQVPETILAERRLARPDYALTVEQCLVIALGLLMSLTMPQGRRRNTRSLLGRFRRVHQQAAPCGARPRLKWYLCKRRKVTIGAVNFPNSELDFYLLRRIVRRFKMEDSRMARKHVLE